MHRVAFKEATIYDFSTIDKFTSRAVQPTSDEVHSCSNEGQGRCRWAAANVGPRSPEVPPSSCCRSPGGKDRQREHVCHIATAQQASDYRTTDGKKGVSFIHVNYFHPENSSPS